MSKHKYGLLLSQLLDCVSRPLEEEQVWALCYEICQSLLNYSGKDSQPSQDIGFSFSSRVTFAVETLYLRNDGKIMFIPNNSSRKIRLEESPESSVKQMKDLSKVLSTCLENGGSDEFLKRQVGTDLEALMRNMSTGELTVDSGSHWMDAVADCCMRHASSQTVVTTSEYYHGICELLVKEAMEMNNFLVVVMNEITQCESRQDAFSTFQLSQARPVIHNWLQCMSEIRKDNTQEHIDGNRSPISIKPQTSSNCYDEKNPSLSSVAYVSPPRSKSFLPTIDEQVHSPEGGNPIPKPSYHSTPAVVCKKTRRVLRPPQLLVNQVTTWILDGPKMDSSYDVSWLPGQQLSPVTSSLGWFREAKRIRHVLTELQIDTAMDDEVLYNALRSGEICFCCRSTKFSLFHRACVNCEVCERKICSSCIARVTSRELGVSSRDSSIGSHDMEMSSHDSGMSSRDFESCSRDESGQGSLLGQIRKVFKPKGSSGEKYCSLCKDCRDFIQRYF